MLTDTDEGDANGIAWAWWTTEPRWLTSRRMSEASKVPRCSCLRMENARTQGDPKDDMVYRPELKFGNPDLMGRFPDRSSLIASTQPSSGSPGKRMNRQSHTSPVG